MPTILGNPSGVCMGSHSLTIPGVYTYDYSIGSRASLGMVGTVTVGVGGCTDSTASNDNPVADFDDGSYNPGVDCYGDINGDGVVPVYELLLILGDFGCTSECIAYINGDGSVTAADIL